MHAAQAPDSAAQRILDERSRTLARVQSQTVAQTAGDEFVMFQLGDGRYALPAPAVREVLPFVGATALPNTPPFVIGLVNVRGRLLSALDLRPLLGLALAPPASTAALILVHVDGIEVGVLADAVLEIRQSDAELTPAFSATAGRAIGWVRGVDRRLNLVLDPTVLLADARLIVNDKTN
jgi:purine-binding chemotaxis protein CheW